MKTGDIHPTGPFIYAVKTTGIYCLPGCASRLPLRKNVAIFDSPEHAVAAGYRPCKRCKPDQISHAPYLHVIRTACETIMRNGHSPGTAALSSRAGLSEPVFRRAFKRYTGITPQQFVDTVRRRRLQMSLPDAVSVTQAIFGSGYRSASRVYERVDALLGMSPTHFRTRGLDQQIGYATGSCFLGFVLVAATAKGLCAIELGDNNEELIARLFARFPAATVTPDAKLNQSLGLVLARIHRPPMGAGLSTEIQGTAVQQRVWQALHSRLFGNG